MINKLTFSLVDWLDSNDFTEEADGAEDEFYTRLDSPYRSANQEIFNLNDLIDGFNLEQVQKKPATFDEKKLLWVSGQHMANISIDIVISELEKLHPNWGQGQPNKYKSDVLSLTKDRSKTLTDLMEISDTFFIDHIVSVSYTHLTLPTNREV